MRQSQAERKAIEAEPQVTLTEPDSVRSPFVKPAIECFPFPQPRVNQQRPSNQAIQQFKQIESQFLSSISTQRREQLERRLIEKVKQINQLSNQQEAVILELMSLSAQLNLNLPELRATQLQSFALHCESRIAKIPDIKINTAGTLILTSRSLQLRSAEHEVAVLARTLRNRNRKRNILGAIGQLIGRLGVAANSSTELA